MMICFKELNHGLLILKCLAKFFLSLSFAIRATLLHPRPSLFLYGLVLSLWCFSILVKYYFHADKITQNAIWSEN